MMRVITRTEIIDTLRGYRDTPYQHQGRIPGEGGGLDCAGILACLLQDLGLPCVDRTDYPKFDVCKLLMDALHENFDQIKLEDAGPADIGVFWTRKKNEWRHVGGFTDYGLVHCESAMGRRSRVVECVFDQRWSQRLVAAFEVRGVEKAWQR